MFAQQQNQYAASYGLKLNTCLYLHHGLCMSVSSFSGEVPNIFPTVTTGLIHDQIKALKKQRHFTKVKHFLIVI